MSYSYLLRSHQSSVSIADNTTAFWYILTECMTEVHVICQSVPLRQWYQLYCSKKNRSLLLQIECLPATFECLELILVDYRLNKFN